MSEYPDLDCVALAKSNNNLLRVAFASSDGETVNQHFGSSLGFIVYGIAIDHHELIISKNFPKEKKDGNEDKLKAKLAWLDGCDLVYCGSIGGSATKQLIALGIHPAVVKGGPEIEEIIAEIQTELNGDLSPALARVIQQKRPREDDRFESMNDEGWDE